MTTVTTRASEPGVSNRDTETTDCSDYGGSADCSDYGGSADCSDCGGNTGCSGVSNKDTEAKGSPDGSGHTDTPADYTISAAVDDIRDITVSLNTFNFRGGATLYFTPDGLKVSIDDIAKYLQGSVFIPAAAFRELKLKKRFNSFQVNYKAFIDCLNIYGNSNPDALTTLKIHYVDVGFPLKLIIENDGVVSSCSLQTCEPRDALDFGLCAKTYVNKIVMESSFLRDAWHDLEAVRGDLSMFISPNYPYFQLGSKSSDAKVIITFPRYEKKMEYFRCRQMQRTGYQAVLMRYSLKALHISTKVSFRTNDIGVLCMQYLVRTVNAHLCFIDIICIPNIGDEDSDSPSSSSG